jgi:predicted MFS family arabinose efflux permease
VLGVAVGLVYAPGIAFVTSLLPSDRANLGVGTFLCGVPCGIVISFFSTPLLADAFGWRWPFWIFAAAALGGAAVFRAISAGETRHEGHAADGAKLSIGTLLANTPFRLLLAALFVGMFVVYGIFTWIAPYLDESAGFSTGQLSSASGLLAMTGIPGTLGAGWLASRSGKPLAVSVAGFCLPVLLVVFAVNDSPSYAVATTVACIAAFGVSIGTSPLYAVAPMLFGRANRATASGLATAAGMTGAVVSTYAGGWIVGASGYGAAFAVYVAATATVAFVVVPLAALSLRRHAGEAAAV